MNKLIYNRLEGIDSKVLSSDGLHSMLIDFSKEKSPDKLLRNLRIQRKVVKLFNNYFYILDNDEQIGKYYKYSIIEQIALVLNKSKTRWHIGLNSAIQNADFKTHKQVLNKIIIITDQFSKKLKILGTQVIFKKQKNYSDIGINRIISKNRIKINTADLERTYLDFLYFKQNPEINISELNQAKLKKYKKSYPKINWSKYNE